MQTAGKVLVKIGRETTASSSGARSISTADLSKIKTLKRGFVKVAYEVCPVFDFSKIDNRIVEDIFEWCLMLPGNLDPDKGLCLYGNPGTGKSTMLAIVKKFCKALGVNRKNGYPTFRISHTTDDVCAAYEKKGFAGIEEFIKSDAQAFDEVGAETIPTGHYGTNRNVMQSIIESRYDKRFTSLTHITTNLAREGMIKAYGDRVWDRCKEMFNFVEFKGKTLRKGNYDKA